MKRTAAVVIGVVISANVFLPGMSGRVFAANGSVTINAGTASGTIPQDFYSTNLDPYMCWAGNVSFYTSATTRTKAAAQQYSLMRIPGGEEGDGYHWYTGAFDVWGSGPGTIPVTVWDAFIEAAGSKAQIIVNSGANQSNKPTITSSVEAANWLEYENGQIPASPDPAWTLTSYTGLQTAPLGYFAWLRGQKGHPAPYNVVHWEIGNENYFHSTGYGAYGIYCDTVRSYYNALHSRAAACGSVPIKVGAQLLQDIYTSVWNDTVIASKSYDALIVHWYPWGSAETENDAEVAANLAKINRATFVNGDHSGTLGDWTTGYIAPLMHKYLSQAKYDSTELWLTEICYNSNYPDAWEAYNPWSAMWCVKAMAEMMKLSKPYSVFNWYSWCNNGADGYSTISADGQYSLTPAYFGYDMLTHWGRGGDTLVSVAGTVTNVDVYAARVGNAGGSPAILVLNKEMSASSTVTFTVSGATPGSRWTWWTYGRNEVGYNNTARSQCQTPPTRHDTTGLGSTFSFTFPAMSVNVLQLFPPVAVEQPGAVKGVRSETEFAMIGSGNHYVVHSSRPGILKLFALSGEMISAMKVSNSARIEVPARGMYVARFVDEQGAVSTSSIAGPGM